MNKNVLLLIVMIMSLLVAGCAQIPDTQSGGSSSDITPGTPKDPVREIEGEQDKPSVTDEGQTDGGKEMDAADIQQKLNAANREFSWRMFQKLNAEDAAENVFISPYSISSALTMALNGAGGNTRTEIEKALGYDGLTRDELNKAYAAEAKRLSKLDKKIKLQNANSIWIRNGFQVKADFIQRNTQYMEAEVRELDFDNASSADVINGWVFDKTNKLIPSIIDPPIPQDVIMYLINAIYFKGDWTTEFKQEDTREKDFYGLDGKTDKVSMMFRSGKIDYFGDDTLQAVRLPYGDEKVSMVLVLPAKDINGWIDGMTREKWEELLNGFHSVSDLQLHIPKFKMEYGIKELNGALNALGIVEAFSDAADFSDIAENICISRVLHKAVVDVNEQGTEAAAVTAVEMQLTSIMEPVVFMADRPFFFAIVENETGNLLFMGKKVAAD